MKNILFIYSDEIVHKKVMMSSNIVFTKLLKAMTTDNICLLLFGSLPTKCHNVNYIQDINRIYTGINIALFKKIFFKLKMKSIFDLFEKKILPSLFMYRINKLVRKKKIDKLWFSANTHIMIPVIKKYISKYPIEYHMSIHDDHIYDVNIVEQQYDGYRNDYICLMEGAKSVDLISPYMEKYYNEKYNMPEHICNIWAGYLDAENIPRIIVREPICKLAYVGSVQTVEEHEILHASIDMINKSGQYKSRIQIDYFSHKYNIQRYRNLPDCVKHVEMCNNERLKEKLKEYDMLIIVMSFDQQKAIQMTTSFPSKTLLYLATGVPILAIAPSYSSIIEFMKTCNCSLFCTDNTLNGMHEKLITILNDSNYVHKNTYKLYINSYKKLKISNNINEFEGIVNI